MQAYLARSGGQPSNCLKDPPPAVLCVEPDNRAKSSGRGVPFHTVRNTLPSPSRSLCSKLLLTAKAREPDKKGYVMPGHDPLQFVNELSSKLASRSRHVCVFLGAGASRACGLPDVSQLEERVKQQLQRDDKKHLSQQLESRNLEQALSRIRRVAALLEGDTQLDGLSREAAIRLDKIVCQAIVSELSVEKAKFAPVLSPNPPKDTDGRREESGRGVRELQGK